MRRGSAVGGEEQEVWRAEGWPGRRWASASQRSVLSRAASSRRREVVLAALEEEDERLKMDVGRWM